MFLGVPAQRRAALSPHRDLSPRRFLAWDRRLCEKRAAMKRFALALAVVLVAATSTEAVAASAPEELGLDLVPYSRKIGERRYQSHRDYEGTIKFFRDKFKGWKTIRWMREVSLPGVKYVHLENMNEKQPWEGVNIYQLKSGEVRFYVLPRVVKTAALTTAPTTAPTTTKPKTP
jgi:hypothetical protein